MSEKNEGFSMIVPVMAISNLVLTQQIYSEETNGAHAHYREPVPLNAPVIGNGCYIYRFPYCLFRHFPSNLLSELNEE